MCSKKQQLRLMSCFAYWDIIPNSCLLLAQSLQEKASFPYSTLRVPRIFSAEGETKIKMTMSTITLCFKESISLLLNAGCELWRRAPTNPLPSLFPLMSLCLRSTGLSRDPAGSGRWCGALCPGFPSVPQSPSWSLLWVSPLPGPTLRNIDPQTFQISMSPIGFGGRGGCSDTSWARPRHFKVMPPKVAGTRSKDPRDSFLPLCAAASPDCSAQLLRLIPKSIYSLEIPVTQSKAHLSKTLIIMTKLQQKQAR